MPKSIQIRNVPESLHRRLRVRAAEQGLSVPGLLRREIERIAEQPSLQASIDRLAALPPIRATRSDAELVRAIRGAR